MPAEWLTTAQDSLGKARFGAVVNCHWSSVPAITSMGAYKVLAKGGPDDGGFRETVVSSHMSVGQ